MREVKKGGVGIGTGIYIQERDEENRGRIKFVIYVSRIDLSKGPNWMRGGEDR